MSFFGKIKDAIFGKKAEAAPAAPAQTTAAPAAPTPVAPQPDVIRIATQCIRLTHRYRLFFRVFISFDLSSLKALRVPYRPALAPSLITVI